MTANTESVRQCSTTKRPVGPTLTGSSRSAVARARATMEVREGLHLGKTLLRETKKRNFGALCHLTAGGARKLGVGISGRRAFHAFCVGAPRTGTTSMAGLFRGYYRSRHEVDSERVLQVALDYAEGKISEGDFRNFVHQRDRSMLLEMDSSSHNYYLTPMVADLFPEAKFLLPIREPLSWLDS